MRVNERILSSHAPQREALVAAPPRAYGTAAKAWRSDIDSAITDEDIAQTALEIDPRSRLT